jgi:hypothetical protein
MIAAVAAVTAKMAAVTETAAAVDITDGKGGGRWHIGGNAGL